jgi:peptidoglycan/LPS O-acetylase OafA/YrhL
LSRRAAIGACLTLIAATFSSRIAFVALGGNAIAPEVFTLFRADALAIGGLVALLARGPHGIMRLAVPARIGLWILAPITLLLSFGHRRMLTMPDTLFAALFACMLVTALTTRANSLVANVWSSRCLRFFGKYSYAIYVFQYPLIPLLAPILSVEILSRVLPEPTMARLLYIAIMTVITSACAIASWQLIEKRFLSLKKYFEVSAQVVRS